MFDNWFELVENQAALAANTIIMSRYGSENLFFYGHRTKSDELCHRTGQTATIILHSFPQDLLNQSQILVGYPFFSMKFPQRGQRPGSFQATTECPGSTGQASGRLCQTQCRPAKPAGNINGGISGREKPTEDIGAATPAGRRNRVRASRNSRQSRHITVCTSQSRPTDAPPETPAR